MFFIFKIDIKTHGIIVMTIFFSLALVASFFCTSYCVVTCSSPFESHCFPCKGKKNVLKKWLEKNNLKPLPEESFGVFFKKVQEKSRQNQNFPLLVSPCGSEVCLLRMLKKIYKKF